MVKRRYLHRVQRNNHLRLVVIVGVVCGVPCAQLLGKHLVRVRLASAGGLSCSDLSSKADLDGQCRADRQNLEQERQLDSKSRQNAVNIRRVNAIDEIASYLLRLFFIFFIIKK